MVVLASTDTTGGGRDEPGTDRPGTPPAETGTAAGGRERILREARARFVGQGFAAVSMQQIADAAGVNKATLYHHFKDKEALFLAVLGQERERTNAAIDAAVGESGPLRPRLLAMAERFLATEPGDIGRLMVDLRQHVDAERREDFLCRRPAPWGRLRLAIEEAVAAGEVRPLDAETVARLFYLLVMNEVGRVRSGDPAPADPDALVGILFDGIAAR